MKTLALVAGALLCASAAPVDTSSSDLPPLRYRALGAVLTVYVPFDELPAACDADLPPDKILLGCTRYLKSGMPVVFLPDPCPAGEAEFYAKIACHENGHALGGWPGDHPAD